MDESQDEDGGTVIRSRVREERGAAAVEFALIMLPLLMIIFAIIQYGFYFWSMQGGADAARQAARLGAVGKPVPCTTTSGVTGFKETVRGMLNTISSNPNAATVTRTYAKGAGNTAAYREGGDMVTVQVVFNGYDFGLPFVPFISGARVESEAKARVDFVPDTTIGNCS